MKTASNASTLGKSPLQERHQRYRNVFHPSLTQAPLSPFRPLPVRRAQKQIPGSNAFHGTPDAEGFMKVCLEDYSAQEQAAILKHAQIVSMPTGGGLANIVFRDPGAFVVELFDPAYLPTFSPPLTTALGLRYIALVGERTPEANSQSAGGGAADVKISARRVLEAIRLGRN